MPEDRTSAPSSAPRDDLVVTRHRAAVGGEEFAYTVTTGTVVLREEALGEGEQAGAYQGEKAKAEIFFVAYTRDDVADLRDRPVTFAFNGGPGSSSVWLHLGAFGPKLVGFDEDGFPLPPPYRLVDNEESLLDVTDLVFIDPVSTGYSRAAEGEKPKEFHEYKKDIESVADFIRLYCSRNHRWTSPKYIAGESYGTTRGAGVAGHLQERHNLYLNGVILVSTVLDFATLLFGPGNDLPHVLYLPAYAATAWYHGRLADDLQDLSLATLLERAEAFARDSYAPALLRGAALPEVDADAIADQVARWIGTSGAFVRDNDLRPELMRYLKELNRDRRRTTGRLDSRFTGIDRDAGGAAMEHDPSLSAISGPFTATFNDYVRRDLGFERDLVYEILSVDVNRAWSYKEFENRFVYVAETLRKAMSMNPHLRVHVASGIYDLATPYFATDYTIDHLSLDPELRRNVEVSTYEAGHMMYLHQPSLRSLKERLAEFIAGPS